MNDGIDILAAETVGEDTFTTGELVLAGAGIVGLVWTLYSAVKRAKQSIDTIDKFKADLLNGINELSRDPKFLKVRDTILSKGGAA